ncbi:diaminopimelate epimerase [Lichenicoccus sp.]|uniref:diaminopimelate epimerase n=1 Tax=Lichenicoccus sp. TaxID=2781899 RepID=UPI003D0B2FD5
MQIRFTKMQAAGNDFVLLDERAGGLGLEPSHIVRIADRRRGIGCDQVILLQAFEGSDAFLRFFNNNGGESGACGNGSRCAGALIAGETGRDHVRLRSVAGPLPAERLAGDCVRVDLGPPGLGWRDIPLAWEMDTLRLDLAGDPAACSMGNPHATSFVADLDSVDVARAGPALEADALFVERANIGFAEILTTSRMRLAVWERGAGLTPACGSGACAALVNAHRRGLVGRACTIEMPGGVLHVSWREDGHVLLSGPTSIAFVGSMRLEP